MTIKNFYLNLFLISLWSSNVISADTSSWTESVKTQAQLNAVLANMDNQELFSYLFHRQRELGDNCTVNYHPYGLYIYSLRYGANVKYFGERAISTSNTTLLNIENGAPTSQAPLSTCETLYKIARQSTGISTPTISNNTVTNDDLDKINSYLLKVEEVYYDSSKADSFNYAIPCGEDFLPKSLRDLIEAGNWTSSQNFLNISVDQRKKLVAFWGAYKKAEKGIKFCTNAASLAQKIGLLIPTYKSNFQYATEASGADFMDIPMPTLTLYNSRKPHFTVCTGNKLVQPMKVVSALTTLSNNPVTWPAPTPDTNKTTVTCPTGTVSAGSTINIPVVAKTSNDYPVPNLNVSISSVAPSGFEINKTTSTTNSSGQASVSLAITKVNNYTISVKIGSITKSCTNIVIGAAGLGKINATPPNMCPTAGMPVSISATIFDRFDNKITNSNLYLFLSKDNVAPYRTFKNGSWDNDIVGSCKCTPVAGNPGSFNCSITSNTFGTFYVLGNTENSTDYLVDTTKQACFGAPPTPKFP